MIRSYFSKEQLETPVLQFFQENLPNISLIRNEKSKILELKWKGAGDGGGNVQASVDVSATMQVGGGMPLSVRSGQQEFSKCNNFDGFIIFTLFSLAVFRD